MCVDSYAHARSACCRMSCLQLIFACSYNKSEHYIILGILFLVPYQMLGCHAQAILMHTATMTAPGNWLHRLLFRSCHSMRPGSAKSADANTSTSVNTIKVQAARVHLQFKGDSPTAACGTWNPSLRTPCKHFMLCFHTLSVGQNGSTNFLNCLVHFTVRDLI